MPKNKASLRYYKKTNLTVENWTMLTIICYSRWSSNYVIIYLYSLFFEHFNLPGLK